MFELIQATLAPVVLISAIALLRISLYERYARIHDRIRHLLHDIETLTLAQIPEEVRKRKIDNAKKQIEALFERGKISKWTLLLGQSALITAVIDSLLIFVNVVEYMRLEMAITALFGLSVLLILVSAILTAVEISKSMKGLSVEIEAATKS
jgi:hypothetical protein